MRPVQQEMVPVGRIDGIPAGEGRVFAVHGRRIAVFRTRGGGVFATDPDCPHRGGPLADGLTGERSVICPLHERTFDLRTGKGLNTECAIAVYAAELSEDGTIRVGFGAPPEGSPASA